MITISDVIFQRVEKVEPRDVPELQFIGLDDIESQSMRILGSKPAEDLRSSAKLFYPGDVLYSRLRPYLNKVWCSDRHGICSSEFIVIPGNQFVDPKFLAYRLNASDFVSFANSLNLGDRPRVDFNQISAFPFPDFSLVRQQAIVAKIETLFSELDKGVESLETARAKLKIYRLAILEGALGVADSSALKIVPLLELIGRIGQGWSPKCELNRLPKKGEWSVIKTSAVQPMKYISEESKPLPEPFEPRPQIEVQVGDFLMTRKGPRNRTGVVCLVRETRENSMLCDTVYRFRCDESKVLPDYLEMVLNSPSVVAELDRRKSGISDSGISLNHGKVNSLPIRLVGTVEDQKRVVARVRKQLDLVLRVEEEIDINIAKSEILRQSILQKAFSGQLVPQDPNDEPASILLERIRTERNAKKSDAPRAEHVRPTKAKSAGKPGKRK